MSPHTRQTRLICTNRRTQAQSRFENSQSAPSSAQAPNQPRILQSVGSTSSPRLLLCIETGRINLSKWRVCDGFAGTESLVSRLLQEACPSQHQWRTQYPALRLLLSQRADSAMQTNTTSLPTKMKSCPNVKEVHSECSQTVFFPKLKTTTTKIVPS